MCGMILVGILEEEKHFSKPLRHETPGEGVVIDQPKR